MKITPLKTFRNKHEKGVLLRRGVPADVDEVYGQELVRNGLAADGTKSLEEHQNKMLAEYQDKGLPIAVESPEQRSQGHFGPGKGSETPEQRTQGRNNSKTAKEEAETTDEPQKDMPSFSKAKAPELETDMKHKPEPGLRGFKPGTNATGRDRNFEREAKDVTTPKKEQPTKSDADTKKSDDSKK